MNNVINNETYEEFVKRTITTKETQDTIKAVAKRIRTIHFITKIEGTSIIPTFYQKESNSKRINKIIMKHLKEFHLVVLSREFGYVFGDSRRVYEFSPGNGFLAVGIK